MTMQRPSAPDNDPGPVSATHHPLDPHRARILAEARLWIGTPYHHRASLRGVGTDCLGLVRGVWRALHGEEPEPLPHYSQDWAEATGTETLMQAALRHLTPTDTPRPGDVLLFRLRRNGPARHCGILSAEFSAPHLDGPAQRRSPSTQTTTLIHALSPHHVTETPLTTRWARRRAGAFTFPRPD